MVKDKLNSYLINCLIKARKGDDANLFQPDTETGYIVCALYKYAIIPIEEYQRLSEPKGAQNRDKSK